MRVLLFVCASELFFNLLAHGKMLDGVLPIDCETFVDNPNFERTSATILLVLCGITDWS